MTDIRVVSLVLTTRNRSELLGRTLERLSELATPGFEARVIVANNGSSDDTEVTLAAAKNRGDVTSVFVELPGKNRALNRALEFADGDLIVLTDDDVLPAANWLAELVAATRRWPEADIFGGQTFLAIPPGTPDWILDIEEGAVNFARYAPLGVEGPTSATPFGPNVAVRSALLESFEFDEGVGPDGTAHYAMGSETAFLLRASRAGHQIVYVPSAKLWHVVRPEQLSLRALAGRSYRFGRGWARVVEPTPDDPYLFGAPRWLWRSMLRAGADRLLAGLVPGRMPVEPLLRYHRLRGMIAEYRSGAVGQSGA